MINWLFPLVGLAVVILLLCLRNEISVFQSIFISVGVAISSWLAAPTFVNLPYDESFFNKLVNINFRLYYLNGVAYSILISLLFGLLYYKLQILLFSKKGFSSNSVYKKYDEFAQDAMELYIVAGDLSFLENSEKQKNKFKSLGSQCKIVCKKAENSQTYDLYKDLRSNNVDIRIYNESVCEPILKARGQIKTTTSGIRDAMFMEKGKKSSYNEIVISNQFLIEAIRDRVVSLHEKCSNPEIHAVAIDWTSICINKEIEKSFWKTLQDQFGLNFSNEKKDNMVFALQTNENEGIIDQISKKTDRNDSAKLQVIHNNEVVIENLWKEVVNSKNLINQEKLNSILEKSLECKLDIFFCGNIDSARLQYLADVDMLSSYNSCRMVSFSIGVVQNNSDFFYKFKKHLEDQSRNGYLSEKAILYITNDYHHQELAKKIGFLTVIFNEMKEFKIQ